MGAHSVLLAGTDEHDLTKLAEYQAIGGYARRAEGAASSTPEKLIELLLASNLRGRGGAGLPDGPQGVADRPREREAEVPGRQRRRVRAGRVQGSRGDGEGAAPPDRGLPDRRARDRVQARLHLHPRRVPGRVRDPRARGRRGARRRALRRRRDHGLPRRRRVHLRRGDGAARLARGPARPAAPAAAVPAGAGALQRADADQQRLHDRDGAVDHRDRRRRSSRRSASSPRPARRSSRSRGTSCGPGTTSSSSERRCAS